MGYLISICKTLSISTSSLNFTLIKNIMKLSFIVEIFVLLLLIKLRHGVFLILKDLKEIRN